MLAPPNYQTFLRSWAENRDHLWPQEKIASLSSLTWNFHHLHTYRIYKDATSFNDGCQALSWYTFRVSAYISHKRTPELVSRRACGPVDVGTCPHQLLAATLTLSQPGGLLCPPYTGVHTKFWKPQARLPYACTVSYNRRLRVWRDKSDWAALAAGERLRKSS